MLNNRELAKPSLDEVTRREDHQPAPGPPRPRCCMWAGGIMLAKCMAELKELAEHLSPAGWPTP